MWWILLTVLQLLLGFGLSSFILPAEIGIFAQISYAVPLGFGFSILLFFFCSSILGQNIFHLFIHMGVIGTVGVLLAIKFIHSHLKSKSLSKIKPMSFIAPTLYLIFAYYSVKKTYLPQKRTFPLIMETFMHEDLSIQSSLLYGVNSPRLNPLRMKHPNYAGNSIVTRWFAPLHSVMLQIGMANDRMKLSLPVFFEMFSYLISMHYFALEMKLPLPIAIIAPLVALFVGGFGFFRFLVSVSRNNRYNDYISDLNEGRPSRFHPFLSLYLGSRNTVYAMSLLGPLFLTIMKVANNSLVLSKTAIMFIGFSAGVLLPAAQHQAFISFGVFFGIFVFIYTLLSKRRQPFYYSMIAFFIGAAVHTPRLLSPSFLTGLASSDVPWSRLYKRGVLFPAVDFWVGSYGIFQLVLLVGFFLLRKSERIVFLPAASCFFIFTYFGLTPNCEYNSSTLLCIFMPVAGVAFAAILYRFVFISDNPETQGAIAAISVIVAVLTVSSAIMGTHRQWGNTKALWDDLDERLADWLRKRTPKDAIFFAPRMPMEPVSLLAGRQVFMEAQAITRNIGIDADIREEFFMSMVDNGTVFGIEKYVDYYIRTPDVQGETSHIQIPENWEQIYSTRSHLVYKAPK